MTNFLRKTGHMYIWFMGKIYLTSSNYHSNDNLLSKLSIATIYPPNYQNNDNVPQNLTKWQNYPYKNIKIYFIFRNFKGIFVLLKIS